MRTLILLATLLVPACAPPPTLVLSNAYERDFDPKPPGYAPAYPPYDAAPLDPADERLAADRALCRAVPPLPR